MDEKRIDKIASKIVTSRDVIAMATIWNKSPYKVSVYPDDAEGKHKKRHVSLRVQKGEEQGNVAISDGEVLNGNLSQGSINWCRTVLLTEENKKRIVKMLDEDDFYRLDRPSEVASHPINASLKSKTAFKIDEPSWEDMFVKKITFLDGYRYRILFADGSDKIVDLSDKITLHPKVFKKLIEHPEIARKVRIEPGGSGIYWDDLMGYPSDFLYEIGK